MKYTKDQQIALLDRIIKFGFSEKTRVTITYGNSPKLYLVDIKKSNGVYNIYNINTNDRFIRGDGFGESVHIDKNDELIDSVNIKYGILCVKVCRYLVYNKVPIYDPVLDNLNPDILGIIPKNILRRLEYMDQHSGKSSLKKMFNYLIRKGFSLESNNPNRQFAILIKIKEFHNPTYMINIDTKIDKVKRKLELAKEELHLITNEIENYNKTLDRYKKYTHIQS